MMSGNIARRASICRSACSSAASSGPSPNITPRRTISILSGRSIWWHPIACWRRPSTSLENDRRYLNLSPKCEPQLGRRGLYGAIGGDKDAAARNMAMLWVLNLSDGDHSLLDIAERAALPFAIVRGTAELLEEHGLLAPVGPPVTR